MVNPSPKGRRVSGRQLDVLLEFLNSNRDIASAFNRSLTVKEYSKTKWTRVADLLNCQSDGAHKNWKEWSKYWVDFKAKLKKKISAIRHLHPGTGEGLSSELSLSKREVKFLQILGDDFGLGASVRVEPFLEPVSASIESSSFEIHQPLFISLPSNHNPAIVSPGIAHSPQPTPEDTSSLPPSPHPSPVATISSPHSANSTPIVTGQHSPRRHRCRRKVVSADAPQSLMRYSQLRAEAAQAQANDLHRIANTMEQILAILGTIQRSITGASPRPAE